MVKRVIVIWLLFIMLIFGAVWEQIFISQSLEFLEQKIDIIQQNIDDTEKALNETKELEGIWLEREKILCLVINYKEIKDIITQISVLKQTIESEEQNVVLIELAKLNILSQNCKNIIGFNIQNVL